MQYWLMKSEPAKFSIQDLAQAKKKTTCWEGVRNYQARNFLRAMKKGDRAIFYHSNATPPAAVGIVEVVKEAYQDPTTDDDRWDAVDVKAIRPLKRPVTLQEIKADETLDQMDLVRQTRLSVGKVRKHEYDRIIAMSES